MLDFIASTMQNINNILKKGAMSCITDEEFVVKEIKRFKCSKKRKNMIDGERYYAGEQDILSKKRMAIGADSSLKEIDNLPNNKIVNNQYKKMIDQKNNYLVGQPFSIQSESKIYAKELKKIFNKKFNRLIKVIGEDSLNCGIAWVFIYYDSCGKISFKRFKPYEVIPGWQDAEHTILDYAIRVYEVISYEGRTEKIIEKVEVYTDKGINYFELTSGGSLNAVEPYHQDYFTMIAADGLEQGYNWSKIPLIPFKYNGKEIPVIKNIKSLQDGLNTIISNFQDNMQEDIRNTILVLVNYDGEDLGEFRQNLATYGAVKVRNDGSGGGDLRSLQVEVNCENYKTILEIFKKAITENAMGYDAKDDRLSGNPNQMNIQSMYSDIDLDANGMETEFQASFEALLWFIDCYFETIGKGNFESEKVDIVFNRNMLLNETERIENCQKSVGLLSDETIMSEHPWCDDSLVEFERIEKQKEKSLNQYSEVFTNLDLEKQEDDNIDV